MRDAFAERIVEAHGPRIRRDAAIGRAEYRRRWEAVQKAMAAAGYDLAYAYGSELDRSDVAWLAGVFDPIIERYGILVPARGAPVVVAGSEGGHVIADGLRASGARLALLRELQISDEDYRFARFESLAEISARLLPARPGRPLRAAILSTAQAVPHDHALMLQGRFGADRVVFDPDLLRRLKYEKSPAELAVAGQAAAVADAAFLAMLAAVVPGARELDVAAAGDYVMKRLGAGRTGFPTIVSSGTRGRTVIGPATNRTIRRGEFVSLGLSPCFNGYHGVLRRTVKAGAAWMARERRFMAVLEGLYRTVIGATRAAAGTGRPANTIDRRGKAYLERTKLRDDRGRLVPLREPYTFLHNTGGSECQEGFGAVTPYSAEPLGRRAALMIDVALTGFDAAGDLVFPIEYAVIEDALWKSGREIGVHNRMPLAVQDLAGREFVDVPEDRVHPFHRPWPGSGGEARGGRAGGPPEGARGPGAGRRPA